MARVMSVTLSLYACTCLICTVQVFFFSCKVALVCSQSFYYCLSKSQNIGIKEEEQGVQAVKSRFQEHNNIVNDQKDICALKLLHESACQWLVNIAV